MATAATKRIPIRFTVPSEIRFRKSVTHAFVLQTSDSYTIVRRLETVANSFSYTAWSLNLTVAVFLLLFLQTSPFFNFNYIHTSSWAIVEQQATHLLTPINAVAESHDAKKVFRLTVPFIAKLFSINRIGLVIIQFGLGLINIWLLIQLLFQTTRSRLFTSLMCLLSASCYFCFSPFYDVFGRVDSYGYFFLLGALYFRHYLLVSGCVFLACFCDERALINSYFVLLFWLFVSYSSDNKYGIKLEIDKRIIAIVVAWGFYFICRAILAFFFQFKTVTAGVGIGVLLESRQHIPLAIFSSYGLAWWLVLGCFGMLAYRRQWLPLLLVGAGLVISLGTSLLVQDINRSLAYSFPLLIISVIVLTRTLRPRHLTLGLLALLLSSLIVPIYCYDSHLHYLPNIVIRLLGLARQG